MEIIVFGCLAFACSYLGVHLIRRIALRRGIVDVPNARSSHKNVTPRGGGLAIVVVTLTGAVLWQSSALAETWFLGYLLSGSILAVIGMLDDVYDLSPALRLAMQLFSAAILVAALDFVGRLEVPSVGAPELYVLAVLVALIWIVGLTNMYNFMDGIDGIAAGQAVVTAGFWLVVSLALHVTAITVLAMLILVSSFGFLLHNKPPARIFMGDGGSTFLGFSFAALPLAMYHFTANPQMFLLGIFFIAPFLFDAGSTIVRRALKRENIFQPHRTHLYQRLVKMGYAHGTVSLIYVCLALTTGILGLISFWYVDWLWLCCLFAGTVMIGFWGCVKWLERQRPITGRDVSM